jgi:hypothetical protein
MAEQERTQDPAHDLFPGPIGRLLHPTRTPYGRLAVLLGSVVVLAVALTWTYLGMRAVMDVGGSCAEGGPYEIAQPCPDGAVLLSVGIPIMIVTAMLGSAIAFTVSAPNLLVPMWLFLFGSLGWNFLEYSFDDGIVWGFLVCGVVFELMALPALPMMFLGRQIVGLVPEKVAANTPGQGTWYAAYAVLGAAGVAAGWWTFDAWT